MHNQSGDSPASRCKAPAAMLFISHNMAVVQQIESTVTVMYLGRIVETTPSETLFRDRGIPTARSC